MQFNCFDWRWPYCPSNGQHRFNSLTLTSPKLWMRVTVIIPPPLSSRRGGNIATSSFVSTFVRPYCMQERAGVVRAVALSCFCGVVRAQVQGGNLGVSEYSFLTAHQHIKGYFVPSR